MSANWEEIFDWLNERLKLTGVTLKHSDIREIAAVLQEREAKATRKMEACEKALKQIRDTPRKREPGQQPCETCWDLKEKAREALLRWE